MHYVDEGRGPTILFVHGTPTWSFEYRHLIARLSKGYRCIAVDHLGFGLSERPLGADYRPEAHARRLARFVDALNLSALTLVAHDFGGPIGLPLALDSKRRVIRMALLNTWMWPLDDDKSLFRSARMAASGFGRFLYRRLNASQRMLMPSFYGDRRKLTPALHAQYLSVFPDTAGREKVLWALARSLSGSRAHYARLWEKRAALNQIPTLLLWGMKDKAFGPGYLARWKEALPQAEACEISDAGHWPHEEEPEQVGACLEAFLRNTD